MGEEKDWSSLVGVVGRYTIFDGLVGSSIEKGGTTYSLVGDVYDSRVAFCRVWLSCRECVWRRQLQTRSRGRCVENSFVW